MPYTVARASSADSHEIALLLRASIIELCGLDHGDNPDRYEAWMKNKSAPNIESWIDGRGQRLSSRIRTSAFSALRWGHRRDTLP